MLKEVSFNRPVSALKKVLREDECRFTDRKNEARDIHICG
jgi:hypothetical protein